MRRGTSLVSMLVAGLVLGGCGSDRRPADPGAVTGPEGGVLHFDAAMIPRPEGDAGCFPTCEMPTDCGNGTLDPGEECDDGAANADGAACTTRCTRAVCGDTFVGPDEECDDGNSEDGDGCGWDCLSPGSTRWRLDFSDPMRNVFSSSVAVGADGSIYALWNELTKYSPTGEEVWNVDRIGNGVIFYDVVMDEAGMLFAVGGAIAIGDLEYTPWIARVDPGTGRMLDKETVAFWLPGTRFHMFFSAAPVSGGGVFVAGSGDGTFSSISTFARVATDGSVLGVDDLGGARMETVVGTGAGGFAVLDGVDPPKIRFYGASLSPGTVWTFERGLHLADAAAVTGGSFVVAGHTLDTHPSGANHGWLHRVDASGTSVWSYDFPTGAGSLQRFQSLVGAYGDVFVGGTTDGKPWIGRLDADTGEVVWRDFEEAARPDLRWSKVALAHHPDVGLVVYGTNIPMTGNQTAWLEVLVP